jgi:hypothetical protein
MFTATEKPISKPVINAREGISSLDKMILITKQICVLHDHIIKVTLLIVKETLQYVKGAFHPEMK